MKQKQLNNIRRRISNVGTQPPDLKPFNVREETTSEKIVFRRKALFVEGVLKFVESRGSGKLYRRS